MRPLCHNCERNVCAINCYHKGKVYYRKICDGCARQNKNIKKQTPKWQSRGYKKKPACERCGFKARLSAQLTVFHINGILIDCDSSNLKTICLNCIAEVKRSDLPWRRGEIEPDL